MTPNNTEITQNKWHPTILKSLRINDTQQYWILYDALTLNTALLNMKCRNAILHDFKIFEAFIASEMRLIIKHYFKELYWLAGYFDENFKWFNTLLFSFRSSPDPSFNQYIIILFPDEFWILKKKKIPSNTRLTLIKFYSIKFAVLSN